MGEGGRKKGVFEFFGPNQRRREAGKIERKKGDSADFVKGGERFTDGMEES